MEHLRVFQALEAAEVRYLVVGGLAVVLHGHARFTSDIDLVVALDAGNVARVVEVLRAEGFRPRVPVSLDAFAVEEERRRWIDEKGLVALSLWNPSQPLAEIDLFVDAPFDFDACFARSVTLAVAGQRVRVLAREDLVAMKRAAGRAKDLEDALALEALGDRGAS